MKKLLPVLLLLVLSLGLASCSNGAPAANTTTTSNTGPSTSETTASIGMLQLVEHPALDKASEGFIAGLADGGYVEGENLTIDRQNAQNDVSNCETIANKFVNAGYDLIFANATPAAQAVAAKTTTIPVVITSVTDPASSGLVSSNEAPGGNVTGTSDLTPITQQIELLQQILPETKTVAIMYCSSEDNSIFQADLAKTALEAMGITVVEATVADATSIQTVTESLIGKVDAIYIPTDNLLAENITAVTQVTNANGLPTIVGEEGMVTGGGLATYGIDYEALGYLAGTMAAQILDGASPSTLPIGYLPTEQCALTINTTTAEALGITIPEDLAAKATLVE